MEKHPQILLFLAKRRRRSLSRGEDTRGVVGVRDWKFRETRGEEKLFAAHRTEQLLLLCSPNTAIETSARGPISLRPLMEKENGVNIF